MSDLVLVALIAGLPPTIVSMASLIASIRNGGKTDTYHQAVNSKMDLLLATNTTAAHAKGKAEGIELERVRKE